MSRRHLIFSELDFQPRTYSREGELKIPVNFEEQLLHHKCRIYDAPTLLFEKRWMGTEAVTIHLHTSSIERSKATAALFKSKSDGIFHALFTATPHTLKVSEIELVESKSRVEPEPLLALADFCLYLEPNKIELLPADLRCLISTDPSTFEYLLLKDITICAKNQKAVLKTLRRISQKGKPIKANEKGKDVFEKLERRRIFLTEVIKKQLGLITHIYTCRVCECILLIQGRSRAAAAAAAMAGPGPAPGHVHPPTQPQQNRQSELEAKLSQATGTDNKQKRKKLKRKIKALQAGGGLDAAAPAPTPAGEQRGDGSSPQDAGAAAAEPAQ